MTDADFVKPNVVLSRLGPLATDVRLFVDRARHRIFSFCLSRLTDMAEQSFKQRLHDTVQRVATRVLGRQLMQDIAHHAHPDHQVVVEIAPVESVRQRVLLSGVGILGIVGIPIAAIAPILPTMPFVLIALVCFARVSRRFQRWLLAMPVCRTALSLVYTHPQQPFVMVRKLLHWMLGRPKVGLRRDESMAPALTWLPLTELLDGISRVGV